MLLRVGVGIVGLDSIALYLLLSYLLTLPDYRLTSTVIRSLLSVSTDGVALGDCGPILLLMRYWGQGAPPYPHYTPAHLKEAALTLMAWAVFGIPKTPANAIRRRS